VGLSDIPAVPFFHRGDYSYGVYLYGYPIQQSVKAIFPSMTSVGLHFAASAVLVTLFAAFSWHVIEKPILSLRKTFSLVKREQKIAG
jgi:peptidoglycan/LPS O-acetylase OafA/YrhL